MLADKAIDPIGESKSDFEAVVEVSKHFGLEEEMLEGLNTTRDAIKFMYEYCVEGTPLKDVTWEKFQEKQYLLYDVAEDWKNVPPGFRKFYDDPVKNPLPTPSGKLEIYSETLAQKFPDDNERGPFPKWIEKGVTHDERLSSDRAKAYSLALMSNHGRWRVHAQCDDISWTREAPTCKVTGFDGYKYEPVWLNPAEAKKRGIQNGDIVKIFNELGYCIGRSLCDRETSYGCGVY